MDKNIVNDLPPEATQQELESLGINPDNGIFAMTPRIANAPFVIRIGTTRVERLPSGAVQVSFGYYSTYQSLARQNWANRLVNYWSDNVG